MVQRLAVTLKPVRDRSVRPTAGREFVRRPASGGVGLEQRGMGPVACIDLSSTSAPPMASRRVPGP